MWPMNVIGHSHFRVEGRRARVPTARCAVTPRKFQIGIAGCSREERERKRSLNVSTHQLSRANAERPVLALKDSRHVLASAARRHCPC